jgi:hypothetical protein
MVCTNLQVKLKFTLQQAMKGPEREHRYNSTLSLTSALDAVDGSGWMGRWIGDGQAE